MNAKQRYTIVYTNGLSYEDYEAYKSDLFFKSEKQADEFLEDNGYDWDYEEKEWKNYHSDKQVARVIKVEELFYYFG